MNAVFHHTWVPPARGVYRIETHFFYFGFYLVRANDKWWNCKEAWVRAKVWFEVFQYFSWGRSEQTIVFRKGSNINEANALAGPTVWTQDVSLGPGDMVTFTVVFELTARADGSGSRAELNFEEGEGNYFHAPLNQKCRMKAKCAIASSSWNSVCR